MRKRLSVFPLCQLGLLSAGPAAVRGGAPPPRGGGGPFSGVPAGGPSKLRGGQKPLQVGEPEALGHPDGSPEEGLRRKARDGHPAGPSLPYSESRADSSVSSRTVLLDSTGASSSSRGTRATRDPFIDKIKTADKVRKTGTENDKSTSLERKTLSMGPKKSNIYGDSTTSTNRESADAFPFLCGYRYGEKTGFGPCAADGHLFEPSESIVPDVGSDAWLQQTCRAAYFDADNHESWAKKLDQVASQAQDDVSENILQRGPMGLPLLVFMQGVGGLWPYEDTPEWEASEWRQRSVRALEELQAHGAMIFATYDVPRILAQARYGAYGMPTLVAAGIFQNGQDVRPTFFSDPAQKSLSPGIPEAAFQAGHMNVAFVQNAIQTQKSLAKRAAHLLMSAQNGFSQNAPNQPSAGSALATVGPILELWTDAHVFVDDVYLQETAGVVSGNSGSTLNPWAATRKKLCATTDNYRNVDFCESALEHSVKGFKEFPIDDKAASIVSLVVAKPEGLHISWLKYTGSFANEELENVLHFLLPNPHGGRHCRWATISESPATTISENSNPEKFEVDQGARKEAELALAEMQFKGEEANALPARMRLAVRRLRDGAKLLVDRWSSQEKGFQEKGMDRYDPPLMVTFGKRFGREELRVEREPRSVTAAAGNILGFVRDRYGFSDTKKVREHVVLVGGDAEFRALGGPKGFASPQMISDSYKNALLVRTGDRSGEVGPRIHSSMKKWRREPIGISMGESLEQMRQQSTRDALSQKTACEKILMQITVPLSVKTLRETCEEAHGCKFVESAQKDTAHACKGKRTDLGEKEFPFRFEAKQTWPLFQKRLEWADRNPEKLKKLLREFFDPSVLAQGFSLASNNDGVYDEAVARLLGPNLESTNYKNNGDPQNGFSNCIETATTSCERGELGKKDTSISTIPACALEVLLDRLLKHQVEKTPALAFRRARTWCAVWALGAILPIALFAFCSQALTQGGAKKRRSN